MNSTLEPSINSYKEVTNLMMTVIESSQSDTNIEMTYESVMAFLGALLRHSYFNAVPMEIHTPVLTIELKKDSDSGNFSLTLKSSSSGGGTKNTETP